MSVVLVLVAGALCAFGTYLVLARQLSRVVIGIGLLGHGVNVVRKHQRQTAKDEGGHIRDVMVSIDGGPLRAASPSDGLFDSGSEAFEFVLPDDLGKGSHRVVLRARDSFGNTATVAVVVKR